MVVLILSLSLTLIFVFSLKLWLFSREASRNSTIYVTFGSLVFSQNKVWLPVLCNICVKCDSNLLITDEINNCPPPWMCGNKRKLKVNNSLSASCETICLKPRLCLRLKSFYKISSRHFRKRFSTSCFSIQQYSPCYLLEPVDSKMMSQSQIFCYIYATSSNLLNFEYCNTHGT